MAAAHQTDQRQHVDHVQERESDGKQAQAIEREDVQAEIQSFETDLMAKAVEIDPEAMEVLARMEELAELLSVGGPGGF